MRGGHRPVLDGPHLSPAPSFVQSGLEGDKDSRRAIRLVRRMPASAGDIEELYRTRYTSFRRALAPITGSYESAHDVVQEAFARAIAKSSSFRGDAPLGAWLGCSASAGIQTAYAASA